MPSRSDRDTLPPADGTSRFHRDEARTRPGVPRTGAERQLPPYEGDRELLLRALRETKEELELQIAASRRASDAPRRPTWDDRLTKVAAAVAVIVGAFAALKPTPASHDPRLDDAYQQLSGAVKEVDKNQRSTDSSIEGLRAWLAGYLASTGVKVTEPQGAPPSAVVELLPAPLQSKARGPRAAPSVQVRTPIPLPPSSARPLVLKPLSK